jgi:hypothetical protein
MRNGSKVGENQPYRSLFTQRVFLPLVALGMLLLPLTPAHAIPSFARQTGFTCAVCHTVFPELTAFGRDFKLHGYTLIGSQQGQSSVLQENPFAPLSAMIQTSFTQVDKTVQGQQNGNFQLPQELSLFYAGRISQNFGTFVQLTYDGQEDTTSIDNTDIRYANEAKKQKVVYGVTVNNNPTVQDLWNTTPAWGLPFASSATAPTPAAATQIDGQLAQQVAGIGGYAMWSNKFYTEVTVYRNSQNGNQPATQADSENAVDGNAPYWRFAWQHQSPNHYFSIGTYGMVVKKFPAGITGPTDDYTDNALDFQYQYIKQDRIFTVESTFINEHQKLNASSASGTNAGDTLNTFKAAATYYHKRKIGGSLIYFNTTGTEDAGLYSTGDPVDGSRTGKPNSNGEILEFDYVPWLNTKFSVQYTIYNQFNGASSNYDGFGRNASDNNTLYILAWLMF